MLRYRELKVIQEGNRRNQDVMDLLREVRRLRDLVADCYGFLGYTPNLSKFTDAERAVLSELFQRFRGEPAVQEYRLMRGKREEMERKQSKTKGGR